MDQKEAKGLANVLRTARETLGTDTTLLRLETLLRIAAEEGQSQREIGEAMKVQKTTVSQNVLNLSVTGAYLQAGPGLVEQQIDPMERRKKVLSITTKGQRLLEKFARNMRGRR